MNEMEATGGIYESPTSSVATLTPSEARKNLEQEIDQALTGVTTTLTSFWGTFKKQSSVALKNTSQQFNTVSSSLQKDLAPHVERAKLELNKLSKEAQEMADRVKEGAVVSNQEGWTVTADGVPIETIPMDKQIPSLHVRGPSMDAASSIFGRINTSIQKIDLSQSQKVAETYLHRGEGLIRGLSKDVGNFVNQAVKVVPPSKDQVVTRRDNLMIRLRSSPALILIDPAQPNSNTDKPTPDTREAFATFLQHIEDEQGGLEGEKWNSRIQAELESAGERLKQTYDELVPSQIPAEAFWSRYFFRVQQIDEDEERRKAVLKRALEEEKKNDEFSWGDDEEDEEIKKKSPRTSESGNESFGFVSAPASVLSVSEAETTPTLSTETPTSTVPVDAPEKVNDKGKKVKEKKDDDSDSDWE